MVLPLDGCHGGEDVGYLLDKSQVCGHVRELSTGCIPLPGWAWLGTGARRASLALWLSFIRLLFLGIGKSERMHALGHVETYWALQLKGIMPSTGNSLSEGSRGLIIHTLEFTSESPLGRSVLHGDTRC